MRNMSGRRSSPKTEAVGDGHVAAAGLSIMYLGLHFNYLGASSVGCLALAVLSSFAWERGWPRYFSKGEAASGCGRTLLN